MATLMMSTVTENVVSNSAKWDEPIDVVYTWVNHADPKWQKLYAQATGQRIKEQNEHVSANDPARFADHGELYWSIKTVRKFAPWVRNIFVLTNCDLPASISEMPGVIHVSHEEVFPDQNCLPTFNSHAIETVLHLIPNLSERFIYFNDDCFLCHPVEIADFFWGGEGIRFEISKHDIPYNKDVHKLLPVDTGAINAAKLLQRDFGYLPLKKLQHSPRSLSKKMLKEIEDKYTDVVLMTRKNAFRHPSDLAMSTTMHAYYAFCTERGSFSLLKTRYINISDWRFLGLVHPLAPLWRGKYHTLCLNEVQQIKFGLMLRDKVVQWVMRRIIQQ